MSFLIPVNEQITDNDPHELLIVHAFFNANAINCHFKFDRSNIIIYTYFVENIWLKLKKKNRQPNKYNIFDLFNIISIELCKNILFF